MDVATTTTNPGSSSQSSFTTTQPSQHSSTVTAASTSTAFSLAPTLPASQSSTSTSSSFPVGLSQDTAATGVTGTTAGTGSTLVDANAPELFKQNVQIAMEQVARVNALARSALHGVQNAYQAGVNPAQTKADLTSLDQALHALADLLRQSGVGAYPLTPTQTDQNTVPDPPTEQQLLADTTRGVQQLYDEFKRMQESSAVVANLLVVQSQDGLSQGRSKA